MYDNPKIIGMGDLNDDPINASLKEVLQATGVKKEVKDGGIYNPMEDLFHRGFSTLGYRDNINLFDQIYMTSPLLGNDKDYATWKFFQAHIFNPSYLTVKKVVIRVIHLEAGTQKVLRVVIVIIIRYIFMW